ncbi:MAG: hypothetical protein JO122_21825 [Acetobacteraceae bacterium]|nr:hypothetical protein [Acetobacteraceae bacterium]
MVCLLGMVSPVAIAVVSPGSAESLKSVVRTLNAIANPEDAWRLEDQARHHDRPSEARYWHNYSAGIEQQRRERGDMLLLGSLFVCRLMLLPLVRRPRSPLTH